LAGDSFSYAVDSDKEENKVKERINLKIGRKDYCGFEGKCNIDMNIIPGLCYWCVYRLRFDIPRMIEEYRKKCQH
jgi:hypothetical protein